MGNLTFPANQLYWPDFTFLSISCWSFYLASITYDPPKVYVRLCSIDFDGISWSEQK